MHAKGSRLRRRRPGEEAARSRPPAALTAPGPKPMTSGIIRKMDIFAAREDRSRAKMIELVLRRWIEEQEART